MSSSTPLKEQELGSLAEIELIQPCGEAITFEGVEPAYSPSKKEIGQVDLGCTSGNSPPNTQGTSYIDIEHISLKANPQFNVAMELLIRLVVNEEIDRIRKTDQR